MEQHLPILQIIVPLIAAPLCLLIRQRTLVFGFALCVCWATFAIAVMFTDARCGFRWRRWSYEFGGSDLSSRRLGGPMGD